MSSPLTASAFVVVIIASTALTLPAVAQTDTQQFVVTQGEKCVEITPLGDGSRAVEGFYDYRSPETDPTGKYSSYGTTELQSSQTSQFFVYRGRWGLSLVFVHDKLGDGGGGSVLTADISGLPANGEWAVEDDTYTERDDVFRHSGRSSHIEWLSNGNRTDGAAFRGLGGLSEPITIEMRFNEDSKRFPFHKWDSPPDQNEIERWVVRSGTGEVTELEMDEPIELGTGTCEKRGQATETPSSKTTPSKHQEPTPSTHSGENDRSQTIGPGFGGETVLVAFVIVIVTATILVRSSG